MSNLCSRIMLMKRSLVTLALALACGSALAQTDATVQADREQLRKDEALLRAHQRQLRRDKARGNAAAVAEDKEAIERDRAQIRATKQRLQANVEKVKDTQKKEAESRKPVKPRPKE